MSVLQFARVHSVIDVDYNIVPDAAFHPMFYETAKSRILKDVDSYLAENLDRIMDLPSVQNVWAVLLERNQQPLYVIRNLAHTDVAPAFRRVLRVDMDIMDDISYPEYNIQTNEAVSPLI